MQTRSRMLKVVGLVVLGCLAVLLYADLRSMHQMYPISQRFIDAAHDEASRQVRMDSRNRRNSEERFDKVFVGGILAIDIAGMIYLTLSLLRPFKSCRPEVGPLAL